MARQATDPIPVTRRRPPDTPEPSIIVDAQRLVYTYVRFVRRHRVLLITLPLVAAVATAVTILSQPRTYAGQLTVTVSRGTEEGSTVVASFRPYLENHRVIGEVIKEFKLDQAPLYLTRTAFLRDYYSVEPIRNTNLVTIRLRLHDRELVARVLNRIGERALELLDQTAAELGTQAQKALKREREEAASRVNEAATALQNFRTASQIELLRKDVDAALDRRTLSGQLYLDGVRVLRLEVPNLVEQRRQLIETKGLGADKLALLSKLYAAERTQAELERRQMIVNQAYTEIATKFELARSRSLDRSAQLVIIDPALPADAPAPRGLVAKTVMAAAAGLVLALLVILFQRPAASVERPEVV
jgi:uncharacterized protein involved in exopolysaccharide biosynthesis